MWGVAPTLVLQLEFKAGLGLARQEAVLQKIEADLREARMPRTCPLKRLVTSHLSLAPRLIFSTRADFLADGRSSTEARGDSAGAGGGRWRRRRGLKKRKFSVPPLRRWRACTWLGQDKQRQRRRAHMAAGGRWRPWREQASEAAGGSSGGLCVERTRKLLPAFARCQVFQDRGGLAEGRPPAPPSRFRYYLPRIATRLDARHAGIISCGGGLPLSLAISRDLQSFSRRRLLLRGTTPPHSARRLPHLPETEPPSSSRGGGQRGIMSEDAVLARLLAPMSEVRFCRQN